MKRLLHLTFLLFATSLNAQLECNYNEEVAVNFGYDSQDEPFKIIEQEDGKFIVAGTSYFIDGNFYQASLARFNYDNTLDSSFGNYGRIGHIWDQRNTCNTASLQDDGKILIGGYQAPSNGVSEFRPYVARLNNDGSVDSTFGIDGSKKIEFLPGMRGLVLAIKQFENGKIQLAINGDSPAGYGVVQLDEFGNYDTTYSEDGVSYHLQSDLFWTLGEGLFLSDGSVIIAKNSYDGIVRASISKITAEGDIDSSFAIDGTLELLDGNLYNSGVYAALTLDEDILLSLFTDTYQYTLYKIDSETGVLVSDFGTEGKVESANSGAFGALYTMATDLTNGDIYLGGTGTDTGYNATLWKVNANGEEEGFCGGDAMQSYFFTYSQGIRAAYVTDSGTLRIATKGGAIEENSDANQGANFVIHTNTIWATVNEVEKVNFSIYPNPASTYFNIKMEGDIKIEAIRVFNQLGKQVILLNNGENTINTSDLASGIYIVELRSGESITRQRVIIR